MLRARQCAAERQHAQSIADCDRVLALDATTAEAYYVRARSYLATEKIGSAVRDFETYMRRQPEARSRLWEHGIALYYAGRFREGAEQFALYQDAYPDDVENAVWRYICMARYAGVEPARREILPIQNDRRVPMMEIYAMFRGQATPDDVVRAARSGSPPPERLNEQLFYAYLYVGLYHEAHRDRVRAAQSLRTAADKHKIGHYMWDVANLHVALLEQP
jgi:lipoprotein NlpI